MDWRGINFDWNRARAFLVTAEEGSLSAAARALGLTQPTLGRQVAALEEELGVALFERVGRGLELTPGGLDLVDHVRAMADAAGRVSLTASGRSQSIEGTVCITATEVASAFVLPGVLAGLRQAYPGISVEIVASNSLQDLRRREADIAIRSARPTDPSLFARRLRGDRAHLYAATSYIDRHGPFLTAADIESADFIGFEQNAAYLEGLKALGLDLSDANFPLRCGSQLVQWELVRQGLGIGVMVEQAGDSTAGVVRAAPWLQPFEFELWLVSHRELQTSRRVRLVFDWLAEAFRNLPASSRG